ncbi:hypothetical protein CSAL01_09468 [Colletotrichum salicis]|uniref:Uncharacterized protein n=1 Tax=Colletotrichum salicis TaxID=1209931 RepID=A0A135UYZ3_9PEZI|nr:hypothetical protein CSAL01_09468 [Colletotrichum salicis]
MLTSLIAESIDGWSTGATPITRSYQISLHFPYGNGDLTTSLNNYRQYLNLAGVDFQGTWNSQEYGHPDQPVPSGLMWNIGQLERHNVPGLRANWLGGQELNDYLAYLLGKDKTGANYDMLSVSTRPQDEYDRVAGPDDLGYTNYGYGDGVVTVAVYQNGPGVGFAFEFSY